MPIHPHLIEYYSKNDESLRYQRQQLEFQLTLRFFKDWLPSFENEKKYVLELGAGSGFYTQWLLAQGYQVTAIEPTPILVKKLKELKTSFSHALEVIEGDETVLPQLGNKFDRILIMGPLYHLFNPQDRQNLLKKAHELLNPGGQVFSVFLSRSGLISYLLKTNPRFIIDQTESFEAIIKLGFDNQNSIIGQFKGHFDRLHSITRLYEEVQIPIKQMISLDPLIGPHDEMYNNLSQELKLFWLEVAYHVSFWPEVLGSSRTWGIISSSS